MTKLMRIVVGVTGSIAAYRSPDFVNELRKNGHDVQVILTEAGEQLVSRRALSTMSHRPVLGPSVFSDGLHETEHIQWARWAELFVIYGATADFMARYAHGFAGDLLNLQLLATTAPVVLVPAMNPAMWEHPALQANLQILKARGVRFVGPIGGKVACGEEGIGHIASHDAIHAQLNLLNVKSEESKILQGKRVLISAGPMRTWMDPVRYLQNSSSGLMGLELARAAKSFGAQVDVLLGPVEKAMRQQFSEFSVTPYESPADYQHALSVLFGQVDIFISASAVLDFEFAPTDFRQKMSREAMQEGGSVMPVPIRPVPDFSRWAAEHRRPGQKVVVFALETGDTPEALGRAQAKLLKKQADALLMNLATQESGPGVPTNRLWFMNSGESPAKDLGFGSKKDLAVKAMKELLSFCGAAGI